MVHIDKEENLSADLFHKSTDGPNDLHYKSAHPLSCKKGIPDRQFLWILKVCSTITLYDKNAIEIAQSFLDRGYLQELVDTAMIGRR